MSAPVFASDAGPLTYIAETGVRTVLTNERPDWCRGRNMMFEVDWTERARYGCWTTLQGYVHIEMVDGTLRVVPQGRFFRPKEAL